VGHGSTGLNAALGGTACTMGATLPLWDADDAGDGATPRSREIVALALRLRDAAAAGDGATRRGGLG